MKLWDLTSSFQQECCHQLFQGALSHHPSFRIRVPPFETALFLPSWGSWGADPGSTGHLLASLVALVVKNLPANAGDMRDVGSIPVLGRSPAGVGGGAGMATHSGILAWRTPWTEEPSRL